MMWKKFRSVTFRSILKTMNSQHPVNQEQRSEGDCAKFAAKIRGGKVEIRKVHIEIYKITHYQNSWKTFQVTSFFRTK